MKETKSESYSKYRAALLAHNGTMTTKTSNMEEITLTMMNRENNISVHGRKTKIHVSKSVFFLVIA